MLPVEQPFKTYTGLDGKPLENGFVYFGRPNENPITAPVTVYWDAAGTIPAAQPLRTVGGYIMRAGTPANVFFDGAYSELVQDAKHRQVFYARTSEEFSIVTAVRSFITSLSAAAGSALIGFIQAGVGAIKRTVQDRLRDEVSVFDFMTPEQIEDVRARTLAVDVTDAMQAARDYIAQTRKRLVFPPGAYKYSKSPNWAIHHAQVVFEGDVLLRYTGVGDAVILDASADDAVTFIKGLCYAVRFGWGNGPTVEALATAGHGYFVRSCHHAKIGGRVRGCGSASAGLRVDFAVCSEFSVVVSGNQDGWYQGAKPQYGYFLTRRNAGETTSYCSFANMIVEGPSIGVQLEATLGNVFLGGTSEACSKYGVYAAPSAAQDRFVGTDFEVNGIADVYDLGTSLVLESCDSYTNTTLGSTSRNATIRGGRFSKVLIDTGCVRATVQDIVFNRFSDGSTLTDAGTDTLLDNCRNAGPNTTFLSGKQAVNTVTINSGALGVIAITVPGARLGDFVQIAFDGGSIGAMVSWGVINSPGLVTAYTLNNTGAAVTVPAGNWRATVSRR